MAIYTFDYVIKELMEKRMNWSVKWVSEDGQKILRLCLPFVSKRSEEYVENHNMDFFKRIIGKEIYYTVDFTYDSEHGDYIHRGSGEVYNSKGFEEIINRVFDAK